MADRPVCSVDNPCTAVQLLIQKTNDMEEDMRLLKDRLPPWVVGAGWVTGIIIGVLGTLVSRG